VVKGSESLFFPRTPSAFDVHRTKWIAMLRTFGETLDVGGLGGTWVVPADNPKK
jgi:hypothetical protein